MSNITNFKAAYKRFIDALRYITENEPKLKQDEKRWAKIKQNFYTKFECVLDENWLALSKDEKKSLSSVYLHRKAQADPVVKKILKTFGGRIVSVKEGED